jgi:hypothetical protein
VAEWQQLNERLERTTVAVRNAGHCTRRVTQALHSYDSALAEPC